MAFDITCLIGHGTGPEVAAPTPEQLLFTAVIQSAITDISKCLTNDKVISKECYRHALRAQFWIKSSSTEPLSFIWAVRAVFGRYPDEFYLKVIAQCRAAFLTPIPKPIVH